MRFRFYDVYFTPKEEMDYYLRLWYQGKGFHGVKDLKIRELVYFPAPGETTLLERTRAIPTSHKTLGCEPQ